MHERFMPMPARLHAGHGKLFTSKRRMGTTACIMKREEVPPVDLFLAYLHEQDGSRSLTGGKCLASPA